MVAGPVAGCGFILRGVTVHAGLEIGTAFGVLVLQVVVVASLAELHLTDLVALLAEHDIFFRVTGRGLLRLVESSKQFASVFYLTVGGSLEGYRHAQIVGQV